MCSDWLTKWPEKLPALSETQSHQDRAQQQVQPMIKINDPADLMELEIYVFGKGTCSAWLVDQRIEAENPGISVLGRKIIPTSHLVGIWLCWNSSILKMEGLYFEGSSLSNYFFERNFGCEYTFPAHKALASITEDQTVWSSGMKLT